MRRQDRVLVCFATGPEAKPSRAIVRKADGTRILLTGMGPSNAKRALEEHLTTSRAKLVISAGFAGGLDPQLERGSVVWASCDATLTRALQTSGARAVRFVTANRVATTAAEKATLRETSGAGAVEMESGPLGEVCARHGIPFGILRVISDAAGDDLPLDFNELMTADQRLSPLKLAAHLLRYPGKIGKLMQFQKITADCAQRQADALERFFRALPAD